MAITQDRAAEERRNNQNVYLTGTVIYGKPGIASTTVMLARRALAHLSLHGHVGLGHSILLAIAVDLFNQFSKPARLYSRHVQWFARLGGPQAHNTICR